MREYNPFRDPDPDEWLTLSEDERTTSIIEYHNSPDEELPDVTVHSIFHLIIENQVAMGDELPVKATLNRLIQKGELERHNAIHAISSALAEYFFDIMNLNNPDAEKPENYFRDVEKLTAQG